MVTTTLTSICDRRANGPWSRRPRFAKAARLAGWLAVVWVALLIAPGVGAAEQDFLPPEQAFRYSAQVQSGPGNDRLVVTWRIEPGYYLYKHRLGFASGDPAVRLGEPQWPRGENHHDEFFGDQEIYRGTVQFSVPIETQGALPAKLPLELKLQGCADAGLCYPPLTWKTDVALSTARSAAGAAPGVRNGGAGGTGRTGGLLSRLLPGTSQQEEFLPPDEAFRFAAAMERPDAVALTWLIADGYYLYRHSIQVTTRNDNVQLGALALPEGQAKTDEFFGESQVYYEVLEASLPVARAADSRGTLELDVTYQGCAEAGLCYNPITRTVALELPATATAIGLPVAAASAGAPVAEQDRLAALIRDGNLFVVLATFFGLGLLLALTPCVLPMIPILSGIIVGQGERVTPLRGFSLAFTYVQGMALTYAAAGAAFVLAFKQAPQAFFQQPWIIILFALLFIALALAMFGVYTLQMPSALQSKLSEASNRQRAGTFAGTFIMGALSALIVTACVAPAIIAALSVISQTGHIARGAGALYATGLGMGVPLLVVGASAGSLLPKVGPWMDTVKSLFGVLFLGVAVYLLTPLLPGTVVMLLWSVLAIVVGFWIFSLRRHDGDAAPAPVRAVGLISLVYGVLLLVGAASGSQDPLQPLGTLAARGAAGAPGSAEHALAFQRIKTTEDLDRALAAARAAGRPVMLDFYADWCVSCKEMEKYTFTDAGVRAALADAVLLQADVTANDASDQALLARFEVFGPPTIAFFGADGVERRNFRLVGFTPAERFREHVVAAFTATPGPKSDT